jgi:hypothetical protein
MMRCPVNAASQCDVVIGLKRHQFRCGIRRKGRYRKWWLGFKNPQHHPGIETLNQQIDCDQNNQQRDRPEQLSTPLTAPTICEAGKSHSMLRHEDLFHSGCNLCGLKSRQRNIVAEIL